MKSEDYRAKFIPSEDDENMRNLSVDLTRLMHNSNWLGRAYEKQAQELVGLKAQIKALENHLFRDEE